MDENKYNISAQNAELNRPKLRKIKRPIQRVMPQTPAGMGQAPMARTTPNVLSAEQTAYQENQKRLQQEDVNFINADDELPLNDFEFAEDGMNEAFGDDAFLNEDENLPTVTRPQRQNNFNQANPQFLGTAPYSTQNRGMGAPAGEGLYMNGERVSKNVMFLVFVALFFCGFIIAKLFFAEEKVVKGGLQGVVVNAEVPNGRARCGTTDKNQGCVLYIMNPQRQDLLGRDFYDLASQLTGRQRFLIETGNMRYATQKIKPGQIGQFNIPPL